MQVLGKGFHDALAPSELLPLYIDGLANFTINAHRSCLLCVTNYLPSCNVLAEVQGIITFFPKQVLHESIYARITPFEFNGEKQYLSGASGQYLRAIVYSGASRGN